MKLLLLVLHFSMFAFAQNPTLDSIPNGFREGRTDAVYGTYSTVYQDSLKSYQDRIDLLEKKVFGLGQISSEPPVEQSKAHAILEAELFKFFLEVMDTKTEMPVFSRDSLLQKTTFVLGTLRAQTTRLFEDMIRYIDIKKPGPNGRQFRLDLKDTGSAVYLPNYRSDDPTTKEERAKLFEQKVAEFQKSGGNLREITELTAEGLSKFGSVTRVEYVLLGNKKINITSGKAGHMILAGGKPVRSAGQIVVIKNSQNEVKLVIITNSSGSYKPDFMSVDEVVEQIKILDPKIKQNQILTIKGEPLSAQIPQIYMKADGFEKVQIKEATKSIEDQIGAILNYNKLDPKSRAASCASRIPSP